MATHQDEQTNRVSARREESEESGDGDRMARRCSKDSAEVKRGILWLSVEERVLEGGRIRQRILSCGQKWCSVWRILYMQYSPVYTPCEVDTHQYCTIWVFTVHAKKRAIVPASCFPRAPDLIAARRPRRWPPRVVVLPLMRSPHAVSLEAA